MLSLLSTFLTFFGLVYGIALPAQVQHNGREVSLRVYKSLEELSRIVDISYCVGTTGIRQPFQCLSRCSDFEGFELVTTWNTGPMLSDSCGYIALSHTPNEKRVIVAFRGTYSIANTIIDLSTNPAKYAPYPTNDNDDHDSCAQTMDPVESGPLVPQLLNQQSKRTLEKRECHNCTVHSGFLTSWRNTRCIIIPHVEKALREYPGYKLTLVGHSLGGAVAALAALEFQARGWTPQVTTFGEPRIGNAELNKYIDEQFNLDATSPDDALYRRVTHVNDPVPLLPPEEWGYKMHAGEIYISKPAVPPTRADLQHCSGDQDPDCIEDEPPAESILAMDAEEGSLDYEKVLAVTSRYQPWQLFFAHRDYFWRLGLCVPGGDPWDWWRSGSESNTTNND